MDSKLERLRTTLKEQNLNLQPLTVIAGPLLDIQASYVIVDDIKYKTESILHAIDLNLKVFYAFDCKYPEIAQSFWQFIQTIIYEISDTERLNQKNRILKGKINQILQSEVPSA